MKMETRLLVMEKLYSMMIESMVIYKEEWKVGKNKILEDLI